MLDHVSIGTSNLARARKFYDSALRPLGFKMVWQIPGGYGYGPSKDQPRFWIGVPLAKRRKAKACVLDPEGHAIEAVCHKPE